jgi:hypothetical protein
MPKINVLKAFVFSRPKAEGQALPTEQRFTVGEHTIDEATAAHPWISKHLADGCIESPEQALARAQAAKAAADRAAREAAEATAAADAAYARATGAAAQASIANAAELERALHTPVNELNAQRGAGIDSPVGQEAKSAAEKAAAVAAEAAKAAADEKAAAEAADAEKAAAEKAAAEKAAGEAKKKK